MKKFLLTIILAAALFLTGYYCIYFQGLFLPHDRLPTVPYRTAGTDYQKQNASGVYETLTFRGVDVNASMPGYAASQYAPTEEEYLEWLTAIGDMGANLVHTATVMDEDFYNALYTYNTTHTQPLYLLAGTSVTDYANDGAQDAYAEDFYDALIRDGRTLVDIIHGRKNISLSEHQGTGVYRKDLSPWVIGWMVGTDWNADTVAYTDHRAIDDAGYWGEYFTTAYGATRFETMLARVMDEITRYETDKYGTQRPIGFANSPATDFLEYKEIYARQLGKYAYIDAENIRPTSACKAGLFATYSLYDFSDDFALHLSENQAAELAHILSVLPEDAIYGGYLPMLADHHTMPVMAVGYGFSTGRIPQRIDAQPLTETEQGEALVRVYREAMAAGWSGVSISSWQDNWERSTWNNSFMSEAVTNNLWHDLQSDNQNYGLMAFVPRETVCTVDGDISEWTQEDLLIARDGLHLSVRYDFEGIYLLVQGDLSEPVYLPMDITDNSGSVRCTEPALDFSRPADFLLCIDGTDRTRLLVQERYDARTAHFGKVTNLVDPHLAPPSKRSTVFVPVTMAVRNSYLLNEWEWSFISPTAREELTALNIYDAGLLVEGQDFVCGPDCMEIRLPWNLLNVGNPPDKEVHGDYYDHYGVTMERSDGIYFDILTDSTPAPGEMARFRFSGWFSADESSRLKDSYYVVQQAWR